MDGGIQVHKDLINIKQSKIRGKEECINGISGILAQP